MNKSNKLITGVAVAASVLFLYNLSFAGDFYKVEKADGSVEYTQTPPAESSKPVDLPGLSVISPEQESRGYNPMKSASEADEPKRNYRGLAITNPADEESIWGADTNVQVQVDLPGSLVAGDKLVVYLNDKAQPPLVGSTLSLNGLDRGEHSLRAKILNSKGKVMASSAVVRFYMKRPQANNLNRVQPRGN